MSIRKRTWVKKSTGETMSAWQCDYRDQNGKRRSKTFNMKRDATAFAETTGVQVRAGTHVADSATITVLEAGDKWIESGEAAGLERSTLAQYRQHLKLHIGPFIGREKLSKLSVPFIRTFQDRLREQGRSNIMVRKITVSLGSLLADAQERGLVNRNAVREMSRKARGSAEKRHKVKLQYGVDIPTREEIRDIINALPDRYRPLIMTAIFSGLRSSELRGLTWDDVDLDKGEIHVRRRADKYNEIGPPKSGAGQRTIPIPPILKNVLKEWKVACPIGDLNLVFPNGSGNIENHANIINRALIPVQLKAGVILEDGDGKPKAKYSGLHSLRHWYASWCINTKDAGGLELPPKSVQDRMGHSSIVMTMDRYGHLFPTADESGALDEAARLLMTI